MGLFKKSQVQTDYSDPVMLLSSYKTDDMSLVKSQRIILILGVMLVSFILWAALSPLDEVSNGSGKVVPGARKQILQTLDGGILDELLVHEGSKVSAGQIVARLDPTRSESNMGESQAKYRASLAASVRLTAEVNNTALSFPDSLQA